MTAHSPISISVTRCDGSVEGIENNGDMETSGGKFRFVFEVEDKASATDFLALSGLLSSRVIRILHLVV